MNSAVITDWLLEHGFVLAPAPQHLRQNLEDQLLTYRGRDAFVRVEFHGGSIASRRDRGFPMATVWLKSTSGNNLVAPWGTSTQNVQAIFEHVAALIDQADDHRRPVESEEMVEYAREVLEAGDYDDVSGTYAYFSLWHGGQSSWSYQALCVLGNDFRPGMLWSESRLKESEIEAYNAAVEKFGGDPYGEPEE